MHIQVRYVYTYAHKIFLIGLQVKHGIRGVGFQVNLKLYVYCMPMDNYSCDIVLVSCALDKLDLVEIDDVHQKGVREIQSFEYYGLVWIQ